MLKNLQLGGFNRKDLFGLYPAHLHINLEELFRHQGLGAALVERFLGQIRQAHLSGVQASVCQDNRVACDFFERLGFSVLGRYPMARFQKMKFFTSKICTQRAFEFIQNIIDGDKKIVVFSQYIETTRMIYEHFKEYAVWYTGKNTADEKEEAREKFMNDDSVKVFSGTLGAAGVGLTLTSADTVMFIDQNFVPADRAQAENRVYRASQESSKIQVIRLITQDTIDEDIEELLNKKEKITSQVLDGEYIEKEINTSVFDDLVKIILEKKKL